MIYWLEQKQTCVCVCETVCGFLLVDDVFSHHSATWNLLSCLHSDEIQCLLVMRDTATSHSHSLPSYDSSTAP